MIYVPCPQCGSELRVDDRYAGKVGRCKKCGGSIAVPTMPPNIKKMYKHCVECGQVVGPTVENCCRAGSLVAISGSRVTADTKFYDLSGKRIDKSELASMSSATAQASRGEAERTSAGPDSAEKPGDAQEALLITYTRRKMFAWLFCAALGISLGAYMMSQTGYVIDELDEFDGGLAERLQKSDLKEERADHLRREARDGIWGREKFRTFLGWSGLIFGCLSIVICASFLEAYRKARKGLLDVSDVKR